MKSLKRPLGLAGTALLLVVACTTGPAATTAPTSAPATGGATGAPATDAPASPAQMTDVRLQLQWVTQSQFAGYFAAFDQCF